VNLLALHQSVAGVPTGGVAIQKRRSIDAQDPDPLL
jgi:hypothetical protein